MVSMRIAQFTQRCPRIGLPRRRRAWRWHLRVIYVESPWVPSPSNGMECLGGHHRYLTFTCQPLSASSNAHHERRRRLCFIPTPSAAMQSQLSAASSLYFRIEVVSKRGGWLNRSAGVDLHFEPHVFRQAHVGALIRHSVSLPNPPGPTGGWTGKPSC